MSEVARSGCVVFGSGNVACALAPALEEAGLHVRQVYSRSIANARSLADVLAGAQAVDSLDSVCRDAELYVVALSDNAIEPVATAMTGTGGLWCHTSGGVGAEVLEPAATGYGVLYPLQTFSKKREVEMAQVPLFVEGCTPCVEEKIKELAEKISGHVYHADSAMRLRSMRQPCLHAIS